MNVFWGGIFTLWLLQAIPESIGRAKESQPEAPAAPGHGGEVQSLKKQLKEKTEIVRNPMAGSFARTHLSLPKDIIFPETNY